MHSAGDDLKKFAAADSDFHQALSTAAGNHLLTDLLRVVRSLLQVYENRVLRDAAEAQSALAEHEAILSAVRNGDADAAASAMAVHMATAAARLNAST